jgi:Cytochrome c554 and c-prime
MTSLTQFRSRILVLVGAILLFLVAGATIFRLAGGWTFFKNDGKASRTNAKPGSSDEPEGARRGRALASIREGRFEQAFEFYRSLDPARWTADDCFALGSALLKCDRLVLGWAALEGAKRIDPRHSPSLLALDHLQNKLAIARGQEQLVLVDAADRVEFLRGVSGGAPLGMMVLGLVRYAGDASQEEEFLDRIMIRDRILLRAVKTPIAATHLVARLLLETGQAAEARDLLNPVVARSDEGSQPGLTPVGPSPHFEAAWLLSRAALQLDQREMADSMLRLASDFAKDATSSPEPSPYVGSKRCGDCHGAIYRDQQFASHHAETLRLGTALKDVPLPAGPVPDPRLPGVTHSFSRVGDDRIELAVRDADRVQRAIIEYAVGSGHQGITMIAKDEQGTDRSLRISYLHDGPTWTETKGANSAPSEPGELIGTALGLKSLRRCIHCHATWYRAVDLSQKGPRGPEARDRGVGCERCHGPGLNHVKAVESGFAEPAIALTSKTPLEPRLKSCTVCHAADGSIRPSDPEFTRSQGTTLLFSRCYTASKDRFGCTTCHDPHKVLDTSIPTYEAKCLGCHVSASASASPRADNASSPGIAAEGTHTSAPSCPVNPTAQCISCHMPKVDDPSRRAQFTDHHIRIHRDVGAIPTTNAPP